MFNEGWLGEVSQWPCGERKVACISQRELEASDLLLLGLMGAGAAGLLVEPPQGWIALPRPGLWEGR